MTLEIKTLSEILAAYDNRSAVQFVVPTEQKWVSLESLKRRLRKEPFWGSKLLLDELEVVLK